MGSLAFLGSGIMRFINMGLIAVLLVIAAYAAWSSYKDSIRDEGRQEVITEVEEGNERLEDQVTKVNETITRRVTNETITIDRRSRQVEDVINDQPSEPIANVTKRRLDVVRNQQGYISETNRQSN